MISKNMYKVLKKIPLTPNRTHFKDLSNKNIVEISFLRNLLREAVSHNYIGYCDPSDRSNKIEVHHFYLTDQGQIAIEEYRHKNNSSKKATETAENFV